MNSVAQHRNRRIIYVQFTNPAAYPPLEHSARLLAEKGWRVLGLAVVADTPVIMRFADHPNITVKELPLPRRGWQRKLCYCAFVLWSLAWAVRWRAGWAYASDPLACPAAWLLSWVPRLHVIYHEHDSPSFTDHAAAPTPGLMRIVLWTRRRLARRARLCVLPNEQRARQFLAETGPDVRVHCVWNCPTKEEVSDPRAAANGRRIWILYHGSIVPARLPLAVIRALRLLPERACLRVVGYETTGHLGYSHRLRETAESLGVGGRLDLRSAVPRHDLFEVCRRCDIGLAFMPRNGTDLNERNMTGASNKAFDYLACGLPVLVSDLPDWRTMYVDAGVGLACDPDDPASIAAALQWLLDHPDTMREMGERGRRRILEEWNYETQFAPVVDVLTSKKA